MKTLSAFAAALLAGTMLLSASPAMARVNLDVHVGIPAPVYVAPRPVYVQPRPVYIQPRPVYVHPPYYHGGRPSYKHNRHRYAPPHRGGYHRHHR